MILKSNILKGFGLEKIAMSVNKNQYFARFRFHWKS